MKMKNPKPLEITFNQSSFLRKLDCDTIHNKILISTYHSEYFAYRR